MRLADAAHDGLHLGPTAERERIQAGAISDTMEGLFIKLAISAVLSPNLKKAEVISHRNHVTRVSILLTSSGADPGAAAV